MATTKSDTDVDQVLNEYAKDGFDKAKEFFQLKKTSTNLRRDLKDFKIQHPNYKELEDLRKKTKELRDEMNEQEEIRELSDKLKQIKERMDLIKEMLRIEMIENAQEEVKEDGKILKLVYIVKEIKDKDAN